LGVPAIQMFVVPFSHKNFTTFNENNSTYFKQNASFLWGCCVLSVTYKSNQEMLQLMAYKTIGSFTYFHSKTGQVWYSDWNSYCVLNLLYKSG
jgi:hypothetical protein